MSLSVAGALALLTPDVAWAAPTGGTVTLAAAPARITFGAQVRFDGAVDADLPCREGRTVRLEHRPADQPTWSTVATSTTAPDGLFAFVVWPQHTASYRAAVVASSQPDCARMTSPEVAVEVAVRLSLSVAPRPLRASRCGRVSVLAEPVKPGHLVRIDRDGTTGQQPIAQPTLDATSRATVPVCPGWEDLGTLDLRASWTPQDALNGAGETSVRVKVIRAGWMRRIDGLVGDRPISVSVREAGRFLYRHDDTTPRIPASNEKLLLSMVLLDLLGPDHRIETAAAALGVDQGGVVRGDLWILGGGDPEITRYRLGLLARRIAGAGVTRIEGSVLGSVDPFEHDWFAPGWRRYFPDRYVPLPSALTFEGNVARGVHIDDPERRAARALTRRLEARGVEVLGEPGAGKHPPGLVEIASIVSAPLQVLLTRQNVASSNFRAEVLGKLLGLAWFGAPGTIARGAAAIEAWADAHGVEVVANDASGLSYANRVTAEGLVTLLGQAEGSPWGLPLMESLPKPGAGTLEGRLAGVSVQAKTGTLTEVSTLSGWVWLERRAAWAEFSILATGMAAGAAKAIEDRVVRLLSRAAA